MVEGNVWLRKIETCNAIDGTTTHLSKKEKDNVIKLLIALKSKCRNRTSLVAVAWRVVPSTVPKMLVHAKKSDNHTIERKK